MFMVNMEKCKRIFGASTFVTSDSLDILKLAERNGAIPILRGENLCGDVPSVEVFKDALKCIPEAHGIISVQANSPTVHHNLIAIVKHLMEMGVDEVMTCHPDYSIYGSVWGISRERLENYGDPYKQKPNILLVDESIDIHTMDDYNKALETN